ncbi:hypothetical protein P22_3909 [Propionispora sp. 2/2-37]|uniref:hypothetical protein n=1 Tax=Propionispora sp. 2/2-37 TaxID=1677858 RepID=UPI0006BB67B7|nr:hypothetical protein [Propionispora sp. 2/2-37]CUH97765.1 hypothetical protein P22_3909 [Propionispora sp. 2/2-37]
MKKCEWELLDHWIVEDHKHRIVFKPRTTRAHLVDITIESGNIDALIAEVLNAHWTTQELMSYLDDIATRSRHSLH